MADVDDEATDRMFLVDEWNHLILELKGGHLEEDSIDIDLKLLLS